MSNLKKFILFLVFTVFLLNFSNSGLYSQSKKKKVYLSFIAHGNMNYDRYVRPKIWENFPVIYDSLLYFLDDHPDFKGQMQLSGQTFLSIKQAAPYMLDHAFDLREKGQLNFTGTFYSEPVNINMDGETNYRCARLGTKIIEDAVGKTDGFYLQERAYHAQLPWILKNSNVSWVPVVTGDNSAFPFKLLGMDGTEFVCVPYVRKRPITERIEEAENNSLIVIENDFEIPQTFTNPYNQVKEYLKKNPDVEAEWILVEDYIDRFGLKEERYIDHTAISDDIEDGTYSRWTADPLDIIVQDHTNKAMSAFRVATVVSALSEYLYNENVDYPIEKSMVTPVHDNVPWNIEQAGTYPEVEPNYILKNGKVTELSRAEHLLVWAVNSDSKGWYPLYERRRERINSFNNCVLYSESIISKGLGALASDISAEGYDRYYILFNAQPERKKGITIHTNLPYKVYDYATGKEEKSTIISGNEGFELQFETQMPGYGYKVVGLKKIEDFNKYEWREGSVISNDNISVSADGREIIVKHKAKTIRLSMDSFMIKALADLTQGEGDGEWRDAVPYGDIRISVREKLYPELRIESQLDWLVHLQQTFTLLPDRVQAEYKFDIPHPTLIRKEGKPKGNDWDPRGLTLMMKTGEPGDVYYDIPFGMSPHHKDKLSYFCPLSSAVFQFKNNDGYMVTTGTGEQAFYTIPREGEMGIFMGSSTSSGPIRDVGIDISRAKTVVHHEPAWYLEPFRGTYHHEFMIFPFSGSWESNYTSKISKSYTEDVYIREFIPSNSGSKASAFSMISLDDDNVQITSMEMIGEKLQVRLNEKEGKDKNINLSIGNKTKNVKIPSSGIINIDFK